MGIKVTDNYFGTIIEECLVDPLSFNKIDCIVNVVELGVNPGHEDNIYHVYGVSIRGSEVKKLPKLIRKRQAYIRLVSAHEIVIVYPGKICIIDKETKAGLEEAYEVGKQLDIGEDHLVKLGSFKELTTQSWSEINDLPKWHTQNRTFLDTWKAGIDN